jgi:hypothetical protein
MSHKASWAITVSITYKNSISQQATVSDEGMTTLREISEILERSRKLCMAMQAQPAIEEAAPSWQPKIVNN